jgi:hypothetical protein
MSFGVADYAASTRARTTVIGGVNRDSGVLTDKDADGKREYIWTDPYPIKSRPTYSVQFSMLRSWTRPNSPVLLVTSVSSRERACAAMKRSFAPIIVPRALSAARIWA